ncbi:hypothetical protein CGC20_6415 [Leishmania donovani]|uniref:Uncharacterized protein n=1 Tax=Leishmania donovani TaxID=5661 RepID=A0A504X828_LEIDO|nr:hypothetical protein CGC20_6415 [Leishmania donovani]
MSTTSVFETKLRVYTALPSEKLKLRGKSLDAEPANEVMVVCEESLKRTLLASNLTPESCRIMDMSAYNGQMPHELQSPGVWFRGGGDSKKLDASRPRNGPMQRGLFRLGHMNAGFWLDRAATSSCNIRARLSCSSSRVWWSGRWLIKACPRHPRRLRPLDAAKKPRRNHVGASRRAADAASITRVWGDIDILRSIIPCLDSIVIASPPARQAELLDMVGKGLLRIGVVNLLTAPNREPPLEADDTGLLRIGNKGGTLLGEDYDWTWIG